MPVSKISVFVERSVDQRGVAVDRPVLVGLDRAALVDRLAQQVEDAAQGGLADRHADRRAGIDAVHAADHAVGAAQGDAADAAAAEVRPGPRRSGGPSRPCARPRCCTAL